MKSLVPFYLSVIVIGSAGCAGGLIKPDSDPVRKQVEACGSGFGSTVTTKLLAEYDIKKKELSGKADAGIEASATTSAAFLSFLPKEDRLEGYKVYTGCLKENIQYPKGEEPPESPTTAG